MILCYIDRAGADLRVVNKKLNSRHNGPPVAKARPYRNAVARPGRRERVASFAGYQQRVCDLELEISRLQGHLKNQEERGSLLAYYREMFERAPVGAVALD